MLGAARTSSGPFFGFRRLGRGCRDVKHGPNILGTKRQTAAASVFFTSKILPCKSLLFVWKLMQNGKLDRFSGL